MLINHPDMDSVLKELPYATDAPFNARKWQHAPTCLPDTRVDLLRQIQDWINGNDTCSIFWLNGLAGTGKSTIAQTVANNCFQQGCLGASFFFSKGGGNISHAGQFFTTIAIQLAEESQFLKRCIYDAKKENDTIATQSYANQWQQLILSPLSKLDRGYRPFTFVLVIDALDECEGDADITLLIRLLFEVQSLKKVRLRIFLTSRPQTPIRMGFNQISEESHRHIVLHNISTSVIDRDISVFLTHNLHTIGQENALHDGWPGTSIITQLVRKADGLFIWAATACRFIEGPFAEDQIDMILAGEIDAESPEGHLNHLYTTVLQKSVRPNYSENVKQKLYSSLKKSLGSIVVLFSTLSLRSLSIILEEKMLAGCIKDLQAIIDVPKDQNQHLRLHHPSFRDFLLNKDRCVDLNFWVDEKLAHQKLMEHCIQLMSTSLKKDICNVIIPGTFITEMEQCKVDLALPPELQYACLFWTQHLQKSGACLQDNERVHQFLQNHFLHWLEALGWMEKISEGITQIINLEATTAVSKIVFHPQFH